VVKKYKTRGVDGAQLWRWMKWVSERN
jgi:hypothetical protein